MKKLFLNVPSLFLFIGLMILCWAQVEFAPTKYSYQATDYSDELNPVAETQFNSSQSQLFHFTGNHGTPLSESEDSEKLDETEGKQLVLETSLVYISEYNFQSVLPEFVVAIPNNAQNKPLYVLFHSWKNHLSA